MKKPLTIHALIVSMGMISSQSWAENSCKFLEGTWKSHRVGIDKHNGQEFHGHIDEEFQLQGNRYVYISSINNGLTYTNTGTYDCTKGTNNNYVIKIKLPKHIAAQYVTVSEDGRKWTGYARYEGSASGDDNFQFQSYFNRVTPVPQLTKIDESANKCIAKKDSVSSETYTLQNICNDAVNLKYTFNRSKPFAGTYVTLQLKQETFETANQNEKYKFLACIFPGVPTAINGKCQ